jgi:hypothetical protein
MDGVCGFQGRRTGGARVVTERFPKGEEQESALPIIDTGSQRHPPTPNPHLAQNCCRLHVTLDFACLASL